MNKHEYNNIEDVLGGLLSAFPAIPVLRKRQIIPWATFPWDSERYDLAEYLHLKRWTDVPAWYLKQEWAALNFMSCAGYVYFLPAYLRVILTENEESDMIPSVVVSTLCPTTSFGRKRIGLLNLAQCKTVLLVMNFIKDIMPDENYLGEVDAIVEYLGKA